MEMKCKYNANVCLVNGDTIHVMGKEEIERMLCDFNNPNKTVISLVESSVKTYFVERDKILYIEKLNWR